MDCISDYNEEKIRFVEDVFEVLTPNGFSFKIKFSIDYQFDDLNNRPTFFVEAYCEELLEGEVLCDYNLLLNHKTWETNPLNVANCRGELDPKIDENFQLFDGEYMVSGSVKITLKPTRPELFMAQFKKVSIIC